MTWFFIGLSAIYLLVFFMINFNHLYYFYVVARMKNVTSAAAFLKTSQPSLSTQIKTLEHNLNKSLFIKKGKYLELTTDGQKVFEISSKMFEIYDELEVFLKPEKSGKKDIRVGVSGELSRPFMTNIISAVLKKYKLAERPTLKLETGSISDLNEKLKMKKLDFIITNFASQENGLKIIRNFQMPVVMAGTGELIRKLKLSSLKKVDLVMKKASQYLVLPSDQLRLRTETNYYLFKNKIKYSTSFESDILASVIRASVDGIGFCMIPSPYIKKELQNKTLKMLRPATGLWSHWIYIIALDDKDSDQFVKKLIREFEMAL